MRIEQNIPFVTADGYEGVMYVTADADIGEDDFTYKIDEMEMIEFFGHKVSIPMDESDIKGSISSYIYSYLDDYISENAWELQQAEADYFHDLAFDRWKESKEHE